jgi:hypothetical protein
MPTTQLTRPQAKRYVAQRLTDQLNGEITPERERSIAEMLIDNVYWKAEDTISSPPHKLPGGPITLTKSGAQDLTVPPNMNIAFVLWDQKRPNGGYFTHVVLDECYDYSANKLTLLPNGIDARINDRINVLYWE